LSNGLHLRPLATSTNRQRPLASCICLGVRIEVQAVVAGNAERRTSTARRGDVEPAEIRLPYPTC
jgi:hypothetical protein